MHHELKSAKASIPFHKSQKSQLDVRERQFQTVSQKGMSWKVFLFL